MPAKCANSMNTRFQLFLRCSKKYLHRIYESFFWRRILFMEDTETD